MGGCPRPAAVIYGEGPYATALRHHFESVPVAWIAQQTATVDGYPLVDDAYEYVAGVCEFLPAGTVVVVSTQLPLGSCARLERQFPGLRFAVQPENVRAAHAVEDFAAQDRFVVGTRHDLEPLFSTLLGGFGDVVFVSPEAAEMSKHAMNTYLAWCIRFGNELGRICDLWGVDADEVVDVLRSERRVADTAPLRPGDPPSEHLLREVHMLVRVGAGPLIGDLA